MTLDEGIRYRLGTIPPSANILAMNAIKVSSMYQSYTVQMTIENQLTKCELQIVKK